MQQQKRLHGVQGLLAAAPWLLHIHQLGPPVLLLPTAPCSPISSMLATACLCC